MSSDACIITRKFGLRPTGLGVNLKLDTFSKFEKVVNTMIKVGIKLDEGHFRKNGLTAVKKFYDQVRTTPQIDKVKNCGLRERVFRCAAQYAYFSTKEYKNRGKLISVLAGLINSELDLSSLFKKGFPTRKLVLRARHSLLNAGLDVGFSYEFLGNMFRYLRNILKKLLLNNYSDEISKQVSVLLKSGDIKSNLITWLKNEKELVLKSFLRKASRLMTTRVIKVRDNTSISLGDGYFDAKILEILQEQGYTIKDWKKARRTWRASSWNRLKKQLKDINVPRLLDRILPVIRSQVSPERILNLLTRHRLPLPWVTGTEFDDFLAFLESQSEKRGELFIAKKLVPNISNKLKDLLKDVEECPWKWIKKPHFQAQSIPLGIDDGQVYDLEINQDPINDNIIKILAKFSFHPREQLVYEIKTPERFVELVHNGYGPRRGVLTRKTGGGLILVIPFQIEDEPETRKEHIDTELPTGKYMVGAIDLGLKTFATISIDECQLNTDGNWERIDKLRGDSSRYFLDQKQLLGKNDDWFLNNTVDNYEFINFKRKLVNLQRLAGKVQSKMELYRNNHPMDFRRKVKYRKLRDRYRNTWRKIKNIHQELIKQIATRTIAFLQYHGVQVLRLEDLSWAKHASKNEVGYFLSTMQVHWFFSQVQKRLSEMAYRLGIRVEKVVARETSQRCWRCGKIGIRTGKTFVCPHCGMKLDSDLNGSRNILVAPHSPTAISSRGRRPSPPKS